MSPPSLRRYRADRMLAREFERQRAKVLAVVRGRLRAHGVAVDESDLEDCYAAAWQGLYAKALDGEEITNPAGWLVLVCFRRAIDEHRSRTSERERLAGDPAVLAGVVDPDLAGAVHDRVLLRQTFEGLRGRLDAREREAASLCYVQGLSRAAAAARMGISQTRMRKLMEGRGPGRPGVAGKVGELLASIGAGSFCVEQGSLMRGLAYGILDPEGERYLLAQLHRRECPACRAYVLGLRGLAAVLPPLALPPGLGAGGAAGAGARAGAESATAGTRAQTGAGAAGGTRAQMGAGPAAGAGGAPALGGSLVAKLAAGGALVLAVGGVGIGVHASDSDHPPRAGAARSFEDAAPAGTLRLLGDPPGRTAPRRPIRGSSRRSRASRVASGAVTAPAPREFGPERAGAATAAAGGRRAASGPSSPADARREFGIR